MCDQTPSSLQSQFEAAIADLWWMSETDAPFLYSEWPDVFSEAGFSISKLLEKTDNDSDTPYEHITLDRFFEPVLAAQDWHGEDEKEDIRRFQELKTLIESTLTEIHVVKMGHVNIDIYILGKTAQNHWIALTTQAVET